MLSASVLVIAACLLPSIHGSAIPMWEYLSRGEKMSHLFNLFVRQVEKHCASRPEPDCSKLLLVYGLTNLAKMEDESLDDMDPYQRGANEIGLEKAWAGDEVRAASAPVEPRTIFEPVTYWPSGCTWSVNGSIKPSVWDSMMKGSGKHNHVDGYSKITPATSLSAASSSTPNYIDKPRDPDDLEASELGSEEAASNINVEEAEPQSFLLGPMVVRVLPNGMPIPGEKSQLPKDEDMEELAPSRFRALTGNQQSPSNRLGFGGPSPGFYEQPLQYPAFYRPPSSLRVRPSTYSTHH